MYRANVEFLRWILLYSEVSNLVRVSNTRNHFYKGTDLIPLKVCLLFTIPLADTGHNLCVNLANVDTVRQKVRARFDETS